MQIYMEEQLQFASAINFNGDDALVYKISTTSFVDIFGRIGNDPGTEWTGDGGYSTVNKTLVRKATVSGYNSKSRRDWC